MASLQHHAAVFSFLWVVCRSNETGQCSYLHPVMQLALWDTGHTVNISLPCFLGSYRKDGWHFSKTYRINSETQKKGNLCS